MEKDRKEKFRKKMSKGKITKEKTSHGKAEWDRLSSHQRFPAWNGGLSARPKTKTTHTIQ